MLTFHEEHRCRHRREDPCVPILAFDRQLASPRSSWSCSTSLAVAAFWYVTWANVLVALVLHWMAVGFGISLGYHRLHTHRGFKTSKAFEYFLAVCGTLTLEGGPIFWVATHRVHHQHLRP